MGVWPVAHRKPDVEWTSNVPCTKKTSSTQACSLLCTSALYSSRVLQPYIISLPQQMQDIIFDNIYVI